MPPSVGVPVITSVNLPVAEPPPPPQPANSRHANAAAAKLTRKVRRLRVAANIASSERPRITNGTWPMTSPGKRRWCVVGGMSEAAVTVTVDVTASTPSSVMLDGESEQVVSAGAPVHVRFTVCVELSTGVTVTVKVMVFPRETLVDVVPVSVKSKPPTPVMGTVCGLLGSSSRNVRLAVATPSTVGRKLTVTVHEAFGASEVPQVVAVEYSASLLPARAGGAEKFRVAVELLVMVTSCGWLGIFSSTLPKSSDAGEMPITAFAESLATKPFEFPLDARKFGSSELEVVGKSDENVCPTMYALPEESSAMPLP